MKTILEFKIDHTKTWEVDDDIFYILQNWLSHATRNDKRDIQKFVDNCLNFDIFMELENKIKLVKTEIKEKSICAGMKPSLIFFDEMAIKNTLWDIYNPEPHKEFKQEIMGKWYD